MADSKVNRSKEGAVAASRSSRLANRAGSAGMAHATDAAPLAVPFVSFARRFGELARNHPSRIALGMGAMHLTHTELAARTNRMARGLLALGCMPGDLLTIALPNSPVFMEVAIACWKTGLSPQPVSYRSPKVELDDIVALADSPFIVGEPGLEAARKIVTVDELLALSFDESDLPDCVSAVWKSPTSGGSTGRPKLILAGQPSIYTSDFVAVWQLGEDDIAIMPGPLYHNGPFSTSAVALLHGAQLYIMPRFDPEGLLREIEKRKATWVYMVPTMMSRILKLPEEVRLRYDLSSLKIIWHLAAPCPEWVKLAWIEWLGPDIVWELYGATESVSATVISGREWLEKQGSVGRAVIGELKIVGPGGETLPPGEVGTVYHRLSPGAPPAYSYRGAESNATEDGWETVGDLGRIDEDGYLFLSDRDSDMILVGGSNVYPAEVEAALDAQEEIGSSAVVGLPDEDFGNVVHAVIQAAPSIDIDALLVKLKRQLVPYKLPRSFEVVDYPVRDEAGKVRRPELRARALVRRAAG